jgi:hypothetical protein
MRPLCFPPSEAIAASISASLRTHRPHGAPFVAEFKESQANLKRQARTSVEMPIIVDLSNEVAGLAPLYLLSTHFSRLSTPKGANLLALRANLLDEWLFA